MSDAGTFEDFPFGGNDEMAMAKVVTTLDQIQAVYLDCAEEWAHLPLIYRRAAPLQEISQRTVPVYRHAMYDIIVDDSLDIDEKAAYIVTLTFGLDRQRQAFFQELKPALHLPAPPEDETESIDTVRGLLEEADDDYDRLLSLLTNTYTTNLNGDINTLYMACNPQLRAYKWIYEHGFIEHAIDVGKTALGATLGGLALYGLSRLKHKSA